MNKTMARILTALSALLLWYFGTGLVASAVQLSNAADRIHQGLGQYVFCGLMTIFVLLLITPIVLYYKLPKALIPPENKSDPGYDEFLTELRQRMKRNPRLQGVPLASNDDIPAALATLSLVADKVVRDTANTVFLGTAVMQNGRLDGLIVLAAQLRMVWKIATIYYQRPSPRQMLYLYSNVSTTVFLADSIQEIEFTELAAPLVASIIPSLKGAIPGLQGIANLLVNSIANGSANAFLTLRVGIVTQQYCETLTTPSSQEVRKSATGLALKLVVQITKENGTRFAQASWTAASNTVGNAVESTVQGAKDTTGKMVDATVVKANSVGSAISSTALGIKKAVKKITERKEPIQ